MVGEFGLTELACARQSTSSFFFSRPGSWSPLASALPCLVRQVAAASQTPGCQERAATGLALSYLDEQVPNLHGDGLVSPEKKKNNSQACIGPSPWLRPLAFLPPAQQGPPLDAGAGRSTVCNSQVALSVGAPQARRARCIYCVAPHAHDPDAPRRMRDGEKPPPHARDDYREKGDEGGGGGDVDVD